MKSKIPETKLLSTITILMLLQALIFSHANAQVKDSLQGSFYKIKEVYLPEEKRPEARYSLEQLEFKNAGGTLPTYDGEQFQVNVPGQNVGSADAAKGMVSQFLTSLMSPLKIDDQLRMNINVTTQKGNQDFIEQQIKSGQDSMKKKVSGQFNSVSKSSDQMITDAGDDVRKQSGISVTVYRFDEFFNNDIIDNTAVTITARGENAITSIQGRFYNTVNPTNKKVLTIADALAKAVSQLKSANKYDQAITGDSKNGQMVLLPYSDGFKYAWRTTVTADGPYRVWIDAETGTVLQLLPDFFFSDNAKGLVFNPDPVAGTTEMTFEVDPASGGQYTLHMTGVVSLTNSGGDGTSGILQIADDGSGTANFNVSPINGTVVERTNQANYNGQFQQVNVYAHIFNERRYYMNIGSQNFGQVNVTLNMPGGNSFCCPPQFHVGDATTSTSTFCGSCNSSVTTFNGGIDATVIAHEFGHQLNGLQYAVGGGSMTGAINEGMADFWAATTFNNTIFGGWWGHSCSSPTQSGWVPRQAESADIFPDRNTGCGSDEAHSAGQIISWANWSARQGMNDAFGLGTLSINLNIIKAMTTAGIGIVNTGTDKSIHDSYLDLLKQVAPLYATSRLIHKLLAGYARAGILLADKDAIIDIDHSYLNRTSATGPTFTVWTGRDYTFSGSSASTGSPPFNTQFMVEVANDEAFTSNLVSSGWLGGVTSGAGGIATWMLPTTDWTTLKAGDDIYYRVTTKDAGGGNIRQSWNPGNSFLVGVPVGRAAINGTGTKDCSCSATAGPSNSAMAVIPIIPLGLLFFYRRKNRK